MSSNSNEFLSGSSLYSRVYDLLRKALVFEPTGAQLSFLREFSNFAADPEGEIFVLRGYAGTGKTTMMSAIVKAFDHIVLLAPTGRAAKVLSSYTELQAYTIHKHLYRPATTSDGRIMLQISENRFKRTLFIVDEASMIPDATIDDPASSFPGVNLLSDLISYVFSGYKCRLLFVGDTAQLPPVHFEYSPALDAKHMRSRYGKSIYETEMTDVVRQQQESGILKNATSLRIQIQKQKKEPVLKSEGFPDVVQLNARDLPDVMNDLYAQYGQDNVLVITRSNKSAIQYNRLIRFQILWRENELDAGDQLMIVKNNYMWLPEDYKMGFIANGDIVEIVKVRRFEERFGFQFAWAEITFTERVDEPPFEVCLILNTLYSEAPAMIKADSEKLYDSLMEFYEEDEPDKKRRNALIRKDPYYNALQIKFAYAVTCHKAQGGQWDVVVVDQGYMTDELLNTEYLRWLYTAFTRAKQKLYLMNFTEKFFV